MAHCDAAHVHLTASAILTDAYNTLDLFGACGKDWSDHPPDERESISDGESSSDEEGCCTGASADDKRGCCTGAPLSTRIHPVAEERLAAAKLSSEEKLLVQWFRESHSMAKDAIEMDAPADEPFEWADMPVDESVAVVSVTQERMQEIGLVLQNGQPPTRETPARFFWIQAKPTAAKGQFGLWDPVGAQWKLYPGRAVVPIEQRIAPCGVGCGGADTFTDADYDDDEVYAGTALEAALPHVRAQVRLMPKGSRVPVASGWGASAHSKHAYYTPHLRHVAIDRSIPEAGGKKYVYKFPAGARVAPTPGDYTWNSTNSCWVYRTRAVGSSSALKSTPHNATGLAEHTEHSRDAAMKWSL